MKQKTRFFTHTSVICVLFILGNAVISLPTKNANEFTFLGYMSAVAVGAVLYLIAIPIAKKVFSNEAKSQSAVCKAGLCAVYICLAVFSVFCGADAFLNFIHFTKSVILPDTPLSLISIIFLAVIIFFSRVRQEDILKFFLIAFWFVLAVVIFFFIATAFKFNLRNIFIFKLPDLNGLFSQAKPYIINPILPSILLPFYSTAVFNKARSGALWCGYFSGTVLLGICVIGSVLLFGPVLSGELSYPYSSAISTVSIGRLFSRLDGFSYFVYFGGALAKITICIFIAKITLKKINELF